MARFNEKEARAGLDAALPEIETIPNQFRDYEITIDYPEFTSVCPKTRLPDFGTVSLYYVPGRKILELKSYKEYLLAYRGLGIFYENAVNRILEDIVRACKPKYAEVSGNFNPRGGMTSTIEAVWPRPTPGRR